MHGLLINETINSLKCVPQPTEVRERLLAGGRCLRIQKLSVLDRKLEGHIAVFTFAVSSFALCLERLGETGKNCILAVRFDVR